MNEADRCPGTNRHGEQCGHPAGWGVEGKTTGACKHHGGAGGAPENNTNAEEHGGYADGEKWFDRHREECGSDVRKTVADWVERAAFDWTAHGNIKLLTEAAINEQQIGNLNEYIDDHGEIVETVVDTTEDGQPIKKDEENPAFRAKSRLTSSTIKILNKFGILDSPEAQQAEAQATLAERLSAAAEEADTEAE